MPQVDDAHIVVGVSSRTASCMDADHFALYDVDVYQG